MFPVSREAHEGRQQVGEEDCMQSIGTYFGRTSILLAKIVVHKIKNRYQGGEFTSVTIQEFVISKIWKATRQKVASIPLDATHRRICMEAVVATSV
jgi:phage terminase Nu1 subunit (DNA packaging protein)